jgi:hypothetical protein
MALEYAMAGGSFGDVIADLHKKGHIEDRQYVAVSRFLEDLRTYHGASTGITAEPAERVQTSIRERLAPPDARNRQSFERVCTVLDNLHEHERACFGFLVCCKEFSRGSLSDYGRRISGYQTNKTTQAAAVGQIRALAASITELYRGP